MRRKGNAPAAAALTAEEVANRLEEHRKNRPVRGPLPEQLWAEAAELAARQGVYQTSRALRLHYGDLKKRADALRASRKPAEPGCPVKPAASIAVKSESPAATFIELLAIPSSSAAIEKCSLEVESVRGSRMRIEMDRVLPSTLSTLIRDFAG